MMRLSVVKAFPDTRHAGNSDGTQAKDVGSTHVVDIGSNPAAIVQFPEMRASFVISGNENRQNWSFLLARIVIWKVSQMTVFDGTGHDGQVLGIADSLHTS